MTFDHHIHLFNDSDLLGNLFTEMPAEYIVKDDDGYGFNISEISEVIKLKTPVYWQRMATSKYSWCTIFDVSQKYSHQSYPFNAPNDNVYRRTRGIVR